MYKFLRFCQCFVDQSSKTKELNFSGEGGLPMWHIVRYVWYTV